MQTLVQDLRYGARMLRKHPGFTLIAVITLALGIGANTAIFSVVDALLLRPLPYHEPERLVMLAEKSRSGRRLNISYPNYSDWRERAQSFEGMASIRSQSFTLTGVDRPAQLLSESLLIALLGGGFGVLAGYWMLDGLLALAPGNIPQLSRVSLNSSALLFTLGISVLTSVVCGLLPALHASRAELIAALKEGGRSTAGSARDVTRKTLLVVEVSLALVLLVGAGLLARSMAQVLNVDPGFNPHSLLTMGIMLPERTYSTQRRLAFYDECLARIGAFPGVRSAALTVSLPISGSQWGSVFIAADKPVPPSGQLPDAAMIPVSPNYFETMGIRLLKGRLFTYADTADSPKVTVINETLAQRIWQGEDSIGKRLKQGYPESQGLKLALIGVVIGLLVAFALTRWLETLLFNVRPTDPLTFAVIAVVLLLVSLVACLLPARRATKVDPMVALRVEVDKRFFYLKF